MTFRVEVENLSDDKWSLVFTTFAIGEADAVRTMIHLRPFAARVVEDCVHEYGPWSGNSTGQGSVAECAKCGNRIWD